MSIWQSMICCHGISQHIETIIRPRQPCCVSSRTLWQLLTIVRWCCLPCSICRQPSTLDHSLLLLRLLRYFGLNGVALRWMTLFLSGLKRILNFNIFHQRMIIHSTAEKVGRALAPPALWLLHPCSGHTGRAGPVSRSMDRSVQNAEVVKALRSLVT